MVSKNSEFGDCLVLTNLRPRASLHHVPVAYVSSFVFMCETLGDIMRNIEGGIGRKPAQTAHSEYSIQSVIGN